MAHLIGMSGTIKGKTFELDADRITLGRASDNTIPLPDEAVSGHHCTLLRQGNRFLIKDEQSTNGTRLNAREITEAPLKPKDLIQAGPFELLFEDPEWVSEEDDPIFFGAEEEVGSGALATPDSFMNVSPFAADSISRNGLWNTVLILAAVAALAGWGLLLFRLIRM